MSRPSRLYLAILLCLLGLDALSGQADGLPIRNIEFRGNEAIPARQLRGIMKLKESRFLQINPFSRRALRGDAITIKAYYASRGYLEVEVADSFEVTSEGFVDVTLTIREGRQFLLQGVTISGNHLMSSEEIVRFLGLETGEPYNPVQVGYLLGELRRHYQDRGRLAIDILEEIEAVENGVQILLTISEGMLYRIGTITTVGLEKVPEREVQRELLFRSGEDLNRRKLVRSQQRIFETNLFSSVEIIPTARVGDPGVADVEVRVRELKQRSLDLSVGFSQKEATGQGEPNTALSGSGQWWHSRIFGTSLRSGLTLEGDLILENLRMPEYLTAVDVITPWTFGLRLPTAIRIYAERSTHPKTIQRSGIELSLVPRRPQRHQLRGSIGWEFITADVLDSAATAGAERGLRFEYIFQGVDNLMTPHEGTIFQIESVFQRTFLPGEPFYFLAEGDIRRYLPLFGDAVFAYRFKLGYIETIPPGEKLAPYHLFNLGGSTSLRGWDKPGDFTAEGGVIKTLVNVELRSPRIWIFGGELFVDAGGLYAFQGTGLEWTTDWDLGAGLLVFTPLGPVRLDVAFLRGIPWEDQPYQVQVGFLHTF